MKKALSDHCKPRVRVRVMGSLLALLFALGGCGKSDDDGKTAGQQLDAAIAKTEQAAEKAKAGTDSAVATVGAAMKDATREVEASGKQIAGKAGEKLNDLSITAAVSAGLARDPELSALKINVDTKNGAVTLTGSAPTETAREKAGALAKTVKGVNSVENRLVVKAG